MLSSLLVVGSAALVRRDSAAVVTEGGSASSIWPGSIANYEDCVGSRPQQEKGTCVPKAECDNSVQKIYDYRHLHRLRKEQDGIDAWNPTKYDGYGAAFPPKVIGGAFDGCSMSSFCCSQAYLELEERKGVEAAKRRREAAEEDKAKKEQDAREQQEREQARLKAEEERLAREAANKERRAEHKEECKRGDVEDCSWCRGELHEPCRKKKAGKERATFLKECRDEARRDVWDSHGLGHVDLTWTDQEYFEYLKERFANDPSPGAAAREVQGEQKKDEERLYSACVAKGQRWEENCNKDEDCPQCYEMNYGYGRVSTSYLCKSGSSGKCNEICTFGNCRKYSGKCACPAGCDFDTR